MFKKRVHVMPVGDEWGVFEFDNIFQSCFYDLTHFGLRVAIYNFCFLMWGKNG